MNIAEEIEPHLYISKKEIVTFSKGYGDYNTQINIYNSIKKRKCILLKKAMTLPQKEKTLIDMCYWWWNNEVFYHDGKIYLNTVHLHGFERIYQNMNLLSYSIKMELKYS